MVRTSLDLSEVELKPESKCRHPLALIAMLSTLLLSFVVAQEAPHEKTTHTGQDIELVTIGNGRFADGHIMAFTVYETPDGTKVLVTYTSFDSLQAAQLMIEKWVKATASVTSREKNQRMGGQLVSDRTLGQAEKSDKKEFVIIRRDDLNCYLIESASLQTALQVESLIGHNESQGTTKTKD